MFSFTSQFYKAVQIGLKSVFISFISKKTVHLITTGILEWDS